MRKLILLPIALLLIAAITLISNPTSAQKAEEYGGRPPQFTPRPIEGPVTYETPTPAGPIPPKSNSVFSPVSLFGMNIYFSGLEPTGYEPDSLGALAVAGGMKWTREELAWANIEPNTKGSFNWAPFDSRLASAFNNNIQVIGMLLTTPRWASTNPSAGDWYWYEPANYNDYYDFVRAAVTRWKDHIHTWEIWNEPNHQATWNCLNNCNR